MARRLVSLSLVAALCLPVAALAAGRGEDPDWPCRQRLVPKLTAASFWSGPSLDGAGDWHAEKRVVALVERIAPRKVAAEEGEAAIDGFLHEIPPEERRRIVPLAVLGLLDETNRQRDDLIARIKSFAQRQRDLADHVARLSAEFHAIPETAEGEAATRRADLEQRRFYLTKAFEDAERTLRYACDAPVQLEARLGAYARRLEAGLAPPG